MSGASGCVGIGRVGWLEEIVEFSRHAEELPGGGASGDGGVLGKSSDLLLLIGSDESSCILHGIRASSRIDRQLDEKLTLEFTTDIDKQINEATRRIARCDERNNLGISPRSSKIDLQRNRKILMSYI